MSNTMVSSERRRNKKADEKKPAELYTARRIPNEDLRVGMRLVTSFHKGLTSMSMKEKDLAIERFEEVGHEEQFVNRSVEIKDIVLCEGQWRTHIHIGGGCYDIRQYSYVVDRKVASER